MLPLAIVSYRKGEFFYGWFYKLALSDFKIIFKFKL